MNFDIYELLEIIFKIFISIVLSGLIGLERQHKHRPAGFRTHILVCIGATLTMMTGKYLVELGFAADVSRLGAQVVSGIGFLGAGTIIRQGADVRGLTTAATLWSVACVGLACGIGYYAGAIAVSIALFVVLKVLGYIVKDKDRNMKFNIKAKNEPGIIEEICSHLTENGLDVKDVEFSKSMDGYITASITVLHSADDLEPAVFTALASMEQVIEAKF